MPPQPSPKPAKRSAQLRPKPAKGNGRVSARLDALTQLQAVVEAHGGRLDLHDATLAEHSERITRTEAILRELLIGQAQLEKRMSDVVDRVSVIVAEATRKFGEEFEALKELNVQTQERLDAHMARIAETLSKCVVLSPGRK